MIAPTILLLDDDEVLRQVLRRVLSRQGLTVVEAADLAQAREVLANQPCQIGLFDLCLPDGDGVELAKEIQDSGRQMPLILMTAYPLRLREQPDLAEKFTRVLSKPVNLQELRQAVDNALAATAAPTPAAAAPALAPTPEQSAPASDLTPAPAPPAPAPEPAVSSAITPPTTGYLRPVLFGLAFVAVAAVAVFILFPNTLRVFDWNKAEAGTAGPRLESIYTAKEVSGDPSAVEVSKEAVAQMKIKTAKVKQADAHRPLQLGGSLALDPDKLTRVRARFAGEVIQIATVSEASPSGTKSRPLEFGDHVTDGQFLGIVYSKDLGEKKSELVDAISQLQLDRDNLEAIEDLYKRGATTEVTVRQARRSVQQDQIAVSRAERTLRTWQLPEEEIEEVRKEAQRVIAHNGQHDLDKEVNWARVDLKSRIDGTVVEKNLNVGDVVDTTTTLFQVADMRRMKAWVNVPEEDLPHIRAAQEKLAAEGKKLTWKITFPSDPTLPAAEGEIEAISPLIDPTQHTAIMMGWVKNPNGFLRASQFITGAIDMLPPQNAVAVPAGALLEDGTESVVFVQPDAAKSSYTLRRVIVLRRYHDVAEIKSELTKEEIAKGYSGLAAGESVVSSSVPELKAALEDAKAKGGK